MNSVISTFKSRPLLLVLPVALVASLVIAGVRWTFADSTHYITGTVEATHIDVSAKIAARVLKFYAEEGERVSMGDVLVTFESKQIAAKVEQARAGMDAADAKYRMTIKGARREEVAMAEKAYQQAEWNLQIMKKTYDRVKTLHEEQVVSSQQWDEVDYKYRAAAALRDAAKDRYLMTRSGARPEEKEAAKSLLDQAANVLTEAESFYDEMSLRAPHAGIVEKKIVDEGELVAPGYPLIAIVDPHNWWVIVNLDESKLNNVHVGTIVSCIVPSQSNLKIHMRVARVSAMSDFATKKATNELNSFDTRTFEVKLVPVDDSVRVAEGASVYVDLNSTIRGL